MYVYMLYVCMFACMYVYVYMHICMYVCMYVYIYVIYVYMYRTAHRVKMRDLVRVSDPLKRERGLAGSCSRAFYVALCILRV